MVDKDEYIEYSTANAQVPAGYGKHNPSKVGTQAPDEQVNNGEDPDEAEASAKDTQ